MHEELTTIQKIFSWIFCIFLVSTIGLGIFVLFIPVGIVVFLFHAFCKLFQFMELVSIHKTSKQQY